MNLKKDISFKKKPTYPTKRTINLIEQAAPRVNRKIEIGLFVVTLIVIAIFAKFLVVDPLSSTVQSTADLQEATAYLEQLKEQADTLKKESADHDRYVVVGKTEEELNLADRGAVFELLGTKIAGAAYLQSVKATGNTITVTCLGLGLQDVSKLVADLEKDERVSYVTVSTTSTPDKKQSSATIEILLRGAVSEEDAASADTAGSASAGTGTTGVGTSTGAAKVGATNVK
ncbi:MAG: hypothetical protein RRX94_07270 [Raoultibacter sp.]